MLIQKNDIILEVNYDFEKGESRTYNDPGHPDKVSVYSIRVEGIDITDIVDPTEIESIEEEILEKILKK